jgi:ribokinase
VAFNLKGPVLKTMANVLVVGDATVDQMYFVDRVPDPGGEITASHAVMEPGGAGGSMAVALARLGHNTRIATRVGTGPFSELALKNLKEAGVHLDLVQHDPQRQTSSVTILVTPDTQRTMISSSGASRHLDVEGLTVDAFAGFDAVVISAYSLVAGAQREYAMRAIEGALKHGAATVVDMGTGAVQALQGELVDLVQSVDYVLMNEKELFAMTGETTISEAVSDLTRRGIGRMVVKVGDMGSIVVTKDRSELVDPFDVDEVIDTTGAGDYFTAAFTHAILDGADLIDAARAGNVAGALNTTRIGAQSTVVDAATLKRHAMSLASFPS